VKTVAWCLLAFVLCGALEPGTAAAATRSPDAVVINRPVAAPSRGVTVPAPIRVSPAFGPVAPTTRTILAAPAPALTLTANTVVALIGQTITFAASDTVNNETFLSFGDSTATALLTPPYPVTTTHAYNAAGTYTAVLTQVACGLGCPTPAQLTITILDPASFSLTATPTTALAGQPVRFHASNSGRSLPSEFIRFGDGSAAPVPTSNFFVNHAYAAPGVYTATLHANNAGLDVVLALAVVRVQPNLTRVPIGQIYSAVLAESPVLAGNDANIILTYRINSPLVVRFDGLTSLQAIVELDDARGHVVRRADPVPLRIAQSAINDVQTTLIPYSVPIDAGGAYLLRVYIRVDEGGIVALGHPQALTIIPGPDPGPVVKSQFRANGTAETRAPGAAGGANVNLGLTTAVQWPFDLLSLTGTFDPTSKRIDSLATLQSATPAPLTAPNATPGPGQINPVTSTPGTSTGSPVPTESSTVAPGGTPPPPPAATPTPSGTTAPTSGPVHTPKLSPVAYRSPADAPAEPLAFAPPTPAPARTGTPAPGPSAAPATTETSTPTPTPAPQPAATPPPAPTLQYKDVLGRTDVDLPALIGGKETLRGLDATYVKTSGWTFHGGAGYAQLASQTTTERTGQLFDIAKKWGLNSADAFRVAFTRSQDNVNKFVPTSGLNPLDVRAGVFEFTDALTPHLTATLTGGKSSSRDETGATPSLSDASDKALLAYAVGSLIANYEYHNGGPAFGAGNGASAQFDRAGSTASLALPTSMISNVTLLWGRDDQRSVLNHTSTGSVAFGMTPANAPTLNLTLERDRAVAAGIDNTTRIAHIVLVRSGITADYQLTSAVNGANPDQNSVTRNASLLYALTSGAHVIGLGLVGTQTVSSTSSATFNENASYSFTFGGHPAPLGQSMGGVARNFQVQMSATNMNMRGPASEGHTLNLTGLLTWHVTPQFAPGLEVVSQRHYDNDPALNTQSSSMRLRLDVTI
jgi:hypothetical protein